MLVEINQFNLNTGTLNKFKSLLYYNSYWHQVIVENVEDLDRDAVLRTLMKFCQPLHFIPVHYNSSNNIATFLLKNCGAAIQKLCTNNLVIMNPFNKEKPFKISLKLCYANSNDLKINIQINLTNILNKRFNSETGVLNLDNFARDPALEEYCALSQPKLFFYILHLAKSTQFKQLKLSNNDIESLQSVEALEGVKNPISIDLRNNNIKDIAEIQNLKNLHVSELWLDGNPICDNYTEITYGKAMKEILTKLEKLDGINVQLKGVLPLRRNFLCNYTGFDLVDQFLEHYFTLYDAQNRTVLEELYHRNALFSMTSMYIPAQSTSLTANLTNYKKLSRNLNHISDFSKSAQGLFVGSFKIMQTLCSLPISEHDPFSFTADLISYTETTAILVVTGVFRESSNTLLESDRLMGFCRTFVLLAGANGEYTILNDMLNITNATTTQAQRAFKNIKIPKPKFIYIPQPQNAKEEMEMTETLTIITSMKSEWSRKCLVECKYDLKDALNLFIDLVKQDKVPKTAFLSEAEVKDVTNRLKNMAQTTNPVASLISPQGTQKPKEARATPQPIITQRSTESTGPNRHRGIGSFGKNISIQKQVMSGPLSPDNVWNKFAQVKATPSTSEPPLDVIDISNSPDDAFLEGDVAEDGDAGAKGQKRAASGVLDLQAMTKKQKKQALKFKTDFAALQKQYTERGFQPALEAALKLIQENAIELDAFEAVFEWFYKTNAQEAREFQAGVYKLSDWQSPFLNVIQLDLIVAKCEYLYGDERIGETEFNKLMTRRQQWARPITEMCKAMVEKNQVEKARALLMNVVTTNHPLKDKMRRIGKMLSKDYNDMRPYPSAVVVASSQRSDLREDGGVRDIPDGTRTQIGGIRSEGALRNLVANAASRN
ncbi:Nuclear transport factor 2 (NTF2) domain [Popillia japonica]|uniref:Nuclear transport factor 2 (NTF2) domain n=1 Tax=Popillia japonica TaxID=7064 RepID=A0AAW1JI36_POPJA